MDVTDTPGGGVTISDGSGDVCLCKRRPSLSFKVLPLQGRRGKSKRHKEVMGDNRLGLKVGRPFYFYIRRPKSRS